MKMSAKVQVWWWEAGGLYRTPDRLNHLLRGYPGKRECKKMFVKVKVWRWEGGGAISDPRPTQPPPGRARGSENVCKSEGLVVG